jgi:hypothetical protein
MINPITAQWNRNVAKEYVIKRAASKASSWQTQLFLVSTQKKAMAPAAKARPGCGLGAQPPSFYPTISLRKRFWGRIAQFGSYESW